MAEIKQYGTMVGTIPFIFYYRNIRAERGMMKDLCRQEAYLKRYEQLFGKQEWNDACVDIGSNIGITATIYNRLCNFNLVVCYEPVVETFNMLNKNLQANNCDNIEVNNAAVLASNGEVEVSFNKSSFASASLYRDFKWREKVKAVSINDIIKDKKVGLLKIDCEGAEQDILTGISDYSPIKRMVIEFHPKLSNWSANRYSQIKDSLSKIFDLREEIDKLGNIMVYARAKSLP